MIFCYSFATQSQFHEQHSLVVGFIVKCLNKGVIVKVFNQLP